MQSENDTDSVVSEDVVMLSSNRETVTIGHSLILRHRPRHLPGDLILSIGEMDDLVFDSGGEYFSEQENIFGENIFGKYISDMLIKNMFHSFVTKTLPVVSETLMRTHISSIGGINPDKNNIAIAAKENDLLCYLMKVPESRGLMTWSDKDSQWKL